MFSSSVLYTAPHLFLATIFINVLLLEQLSFPSDRPTGSESKLKKAESLEQNLCLFAVTTPFTRKCQFNYSAIRPLTLINPEEAVCISYHTLLPRQSFHSPNYKNTNTHTYASSVPSCLFFIFTLSSLFLFHRSWEPQPLRRPSDYPGSMSDHRGGYRE